MSVAVLVVPSIRGLGPLCHSSRFSLRMKLSRRKWSYFFNTISSEYQSTLSTFYNICWGTSEFYQAFLEAQDDKQDIHISEWEFGKKFHGDLDKKEIFSQKRVARYQYGRDPDTMGYSLGKPVVDCTQKQFLRREGKDRVVLVFTLEMNGEVMSDCFVVHIRAVATRMKVDPSSSNGNDLMSTAIGVDFGVFCEFTKQTLLAKTIRKITRDATRESLMTLVLQAKEACGALEEHDEESGLPYLCSGVTQSAEAEESTTCRPFRLFHDCIPRPPRASQNVLDDVDLTRVEIDSKLHEISQIKRRGIQDLNSALTELSTDFEHVVNALNQTIQRAQRKENEWIEAQVASTIPPDKTKKVDLFSFHFVPRSDMIHFLRRIQPVQFHQNDPAHPDNILTKMTISLYELSGGTPSDFHALFYEEGKDFLHSLLESHRFEQISIGQLEKPRGSQSFIESWSGETFIARRSLSGRLQIGSEVNQIHQTQYLRMEGFDKFVLAIHGWTTGEWFSFLFETHVRWVVERREKGPSSVKVGLFASIFEHSETASMASAGIYRVMRMNQLAWTEVAFQRVDKDYVPGTVSSTESFSSQHQRNAIMQTRDLVHGHQLYFWPRKHWARLVVVPGTLLACDDELFESFYQIRKKLQEVDDIFKELQLDHEMSSFASMQLSIVLDSLANSIMRYQEPLNHKERFQKKKHAIDSLKNFLAYGSRSL